ncbi:alpha/beta hydrolase [Halopelagius fulvigenes]|uniref:Alpha/beta hydrolase n=1 Tax=Halopelagius fulvigenes TaxID=1198324 RepID=A0ABD5TYS3_9EURY
MAETVLVPGGRDVRASLDEADGGDAAACVVACPPHPQQSGHRGDDRLVAVSDELTARGVDCLRFDYGAWDEGYGEKADARNAVAWARERYDRAGLFGFSFGATVALLAAAEGAPTEAVSALAPTARLADDLDAAASFDDIPVPVQVLYGTRDDTVEWEPVVERARETHQSVEEFSADHFFVGQAGKVAVRAADFLLTFLQATDSR